MIFFHPDGYGLSHWNTLRYYLAGPDGRLNWDKLPYMVPYTGHMKDALTGTSHGGATVHAYGMKVVADSFGLDGHQEITALSGKKMSIMEEAIAAGFATALVQTGEITEPGTAVFVSSVEERDNREEIARQVIESGVDVILSGGERFLLPESVTGRHGKGARKDGVNLIERAKALGYTVVYTRDELMAVPATVSKVLGVFAHGHTFNDVTEEKLRAEGLPLFWPWAPTIAEMSAATLEILARNPKAAERGIFVVAEEEATDNFPNNANARGSFEAGKRADEAFGVFVEFVANNPNTLLITAADSSAGGKHIIGPDPAWMARLLVDGKVGEADINSGPDGKFVRAPVDGIDGAGTEPFLAAADKAGNRWPFAVTWATRHDLSGGIVARAKGLNAERVTELGVVDNTDIYRIMYYTLFDRWLPAFP
ncbi:MAG: Alkaline phosphatase [Chloroflexi bacterium]|nr:Alkaline phosphatase [Chloroflexota bacterium]